jgi:hypothetical protein
MNEGIVRSVIGFQSESQRIDFYMTTSTAGVAPMSFKALSKAQVFTTLGFL